MLRTFQFGLILLMLVVLAMISALVTMRLAIHGAEVTIPSFRSLTVDEAVNKAAALGLHLNVASHYYSADIPAGHIMLQSPAPGTVVRRDWHVMLTESLGPRRVAIPNLIGLNQQFASIQIRRAGLEVGTIATMPWAYAPAGAVIAQNPAPGAAGVARPNVSLLIAAPPVTVSAAYVMPNFVGEMFPSAAFAVAHAGLTLVPVKTAPVVIPSAGSTNPTQPLPPIVPSGSVVSQSPAPGARVDSSTPIQFTVAQ